MKCRSSRCSQQSILNPAKCFVCHDDNVDDDKLRLSHQPRESKSFVLACRPTRNMKSVAFHSTESCVGGGAKQIELHVFPAIVLVIMVNIALWLEVGAASPYWHRLFTALRRLPCMIDKTAERALCEERGANATRVYPALWKNPLNRNTLKVYRSRPENCHARSFSSAFNSHVLFELRSRFSSIHLPC